MRFIGLSSGLLTLTIASAVLAGSTSGQTVTHVSATETRGVLRDARFSSNTVEFIGCIVQNNAFVGCYMKDAAGTNRVCTTTAAGFATAAAAIGPNSHLTIRYNSSGTCTGLDVYNSSLYVD